MGQGDEARHKLRSGRNRGDARPTQRDPQGAARTLSTDGADLCVSACRPRTKHSASDVQSLSRKRRDAALTRVQQRNDSRTGCSHLSQTRVCLQVICFALIFALGISCRPALAIAAATSSRTATWVARQLQQGHRVVLNGVTVNGALDLAADALDPDQVVERGDASGCEHGEAGRLDHAFEQPDIGSCERSVARRARDQQTPDPCLGACARELGCRQRRCSRPAVDDDEPIARVDRDDEALTELRCGLAQETGRERGGASISITSSILWSRRLRANSAR